MQQIINTEFMKVIYRDDRCVVISTQEIGLVVYVFKSFCEGDSHIAIHAICETVQKDYSFSIDKYNTLEECVFWEGLTERFIKDFSCC